MFRKEGLEEIKSDIERAKDIHSLKGIATAMLAATEYAAEEIAQLKAELEQFRWKPISQYVKPTSGSDCQSFIGQTVSGRVFECYWSHIDQEFGAYGGPAEPAYFMEYPKAHLAGRGE